MLDVEKKEAGMGKAKKRIEITGLRKRWLFNSLGPIFVVTLLVGGPSAPVWLITTII